MTTESATKQARSNAFVHHDFPEPVVATVGRTGVQKTVPGYYEKWSTSSANDGWPFERAVSATPAEIRHAQELRVRLRERYGDNAQPTARAYCVDAD
jgi:hypothetical protein